MIMRAFSQLLTILLILVSLSRNDAYQHQAALQAYRESRSTSLMATATAGGAKPSLVIGTRGSPLALAQAHETKRLIEQQFPEYAREGAIDIKKIMTTGDSILNQALSEIGGKGLFTKELDRALLDNSVDICVHSMKDVPTVIPGGTVLPCMLQREETNDVFISRDRKKLADLPDGSIIGSASLRRQAQLLARNPTWKVVNFRGNVQTRLRKMEEGQVDATMLALAGLKRLGMKDLLSSPQTQSLTWAEMLPAVAQGAIGIQCRQTDQPMLAILAALNHVETQLTVECERAFLYGLEGDCRTPIAGQAKLIRSGTVDWPSRVALHFSGLISLPDGSETERVELTSDFFDLDAAKKSAKGNNDNLVLAKALGTRAAAELVRRLGEQRFAHFKRSSATVVSQMAAASKTPPRQLQSSSSLAIVSSSGRNGFMQYLSEHRNQIVLDLQQLYGSDSAAVTGRSLNTAVASEAGRRWKALDEESKTGYTQRGAAAAPSEAALARRRRKQLGDDDSDDIAAALKRKKNGFMVFLAERRDKIKNDILQRAPTLSGREVTVAVSVAAGDTWRSMSAEERNEFNSRAAAMPAVAKTPKVSLPRKKQTKNSFMLFMEDRRASIKAQLVKKNPALTGKELSTEVAREAGAAWRAASAEEKAVYEQRQRRLASFGGRAFSVDEVAQHNKGSDCWLIVDDKVYDVSEFVEGHPGGYAILNNAGGDSTVGFYGEQHPKDVVEVLRQYYIGDLEKKKTTKAVPLTRGN